MIPAAIQHIMLPAIADATLAAMRQFEQQVAQCEQAPITTYHLIHAGMYARTITIPAGVVLTGALIKRATILIVNGDVSVNGGMRLTGYNVLPASAHRKQAFLAHSDTQLTMLFPTDAKDISAAEEEFTDEADRLFSRQGENVVSVTED